ncbi:MAG TPA: hypothetical protein VFJ96_09525 [Gemmatimonadaceae bacterium]|nr:hypothetical protein [Gemmatimonadaceae bacterium]
MRRSPALPLLVAVLAGCAKADAPAAGPSAPLRATAVAARAPAPLNGLDASDHAALARFHLTTANVARTTQATRNIAALNATDPRLLKRLDQEAPLSDAQTLQEMADRLASIPQVRSAIERAGLSPREYVLVYYTIAQAIVDDAHATPGGTTPATVTVSTDNLAFVAAHRSAIQQFMQALQAMAPRGHADGAGGP